MKKTYIKMIMQMSEHANINTLKKMNVWQLKDAYDALIFKAKCKGDM